MVVLHLTFRFPPQTFKTKHIDNIPTFVKKLHLINMKDKVIKGVNSTSMQANTLLEQKKKRKDTSPYKQTQKQRHYQSLLL